MMFMVSMSGDPIPSFMILGKKRTGPPILPYSSKLISGLSVIAYQFQMIKKVRNLFLQPMI